MNTIENLFQQAQLAEAAYGNFIDPQTNLPYTDASKILGVLITEKFSLAQATAFAAEWSIISHQPDTINGFSATLFKNNITGQYSLAIRGSTPAQSGVDFGIDARLIADGIAALQVVDLYNYWQSINTAAGTIYDAAVLVALSTSELIQYSASQLIYDTFSNTYCTIKFVASNTLADTALQTGSGALAVCPADLNVAGHSLGGHLTMAFSRLFSNVASSATSVNGLGFAIDSSNVNNLFSMLGGAAAFTAAQIQNIYGIAGPEFAAINSSSLQQPGAWDGIYIESASPLPPIAGGHSTGQMTDSLAVYNLFATLDPSLSVASAGNLDKISNILKASSNVAANSLESAVSALGKLFNVTSATGFVANEFDSNRDLLYTALHDIAAVLPASGLSLVAIDAATIVTSAKADAGAMPHAFAYRYALVNGNPFAVLGADYSAHNASGELDLFNPADHTGSLTNQYLTDRAIWLSHQLSANVLDTDTVHTRNTSDWLYTDLTPHSTLTVKGGLMASTAPARKIIFGSDSSDDGVLSVSPILEGGSEADRLYGMGGNDKLKGNGGNDFLEGGSGTDSYIWNSGDGLDSIRDTDGLGLLVINGQTLAGGASKNGGKTYTLKDGAGGNHVCAVLSGDINAASGATLLIDNALEVFNYRNGDLGINLAGAVVAPPVNPNLIGNAADNFIGAQVYNRNPDNSLVYQATLDGGAYPLGTNLSGSDVANILEGGAGSDILNGGAGDDRLYANVEISNEYAIAIGNVSATAGSGLRGDWLAGGLGDDTLVAGADNDVLAGGAGSDLLIAGAGDDDIIGDVPMVATRFDWTVTDQVVTDPVTGEAITNRVFDTYATTYTLGEQGAADVIHAGSGNDHAWGGEGDDVIYGEDGNDILSGNDGNDVVMGGTGADTLHGDGTGATWQTTVDGNDYIDGGAGDDQIFGDGGDDILFGGADTDTLWGGAGKDYLDGEAGADTLVGNGGDDLLYGGTGDDVLWGSEDNDTLDGGDGIDTLWGGNGGDMLTGGTGNDKLYGETGANYLDGGDGNDTLNSGGPGSTLVGGLGDDDISAAGGGNTLNGGEGNDTLVADGGDNYLDGGNGVNNVHASGGSNALFAGSGNDELAAWGDGNYLDAGDGNNTLYAQGANNELYGGAGNDTLTAAGGGGYLDGGNGTNTLVADGGNNALYGGTGDDFLSASGGNNYLDGGDGNAANDSEWRVAA